MHTLYKWIETCGNMTFICELDIFHMKTVIICLSGGLPLAAALEKIYLNMQTSYFELHILLASYLIPVRSMGPRL